MRRAQESQKLVQWVNSELQLDAGTLDELKNGIALVQIIHKIAPDSFDLSRCDFLASTPYHYEKNFKLLQEVMAKCDINRNFTVERMMEGEKQRDLYIFVSYLKLHFDTFKTQREWRIEDERKVTKKALTMMGNSTSSVAASDSLGTPVSVGVWPPSASSTATNKKPPRPPPLTGPESARTPGGLKTTATFDGADETTPQGGGGGDDNDNDVVDENDNDASPNSNSANNTKSAVKKRDGTDGKSPSAGSTVRIAYDAISERKRAMAIRRARVTTRTTSTRDTMSTSDQSSVPSARYSTGNIGIGRNGFPSRFRTAGRLKQLGGAGGGSAHRSIIGDWAEGIQVPYHATGSMSNISSSRCSTPTTGGRRTPDPGTPHNVATAMDGGSGGATPQPGATPQHPAAQQHQQAHHSTVVLRSGGSIPPSPLSAMHYQQTSFARNYSSLGGTNNTEIGQLMGQGIGVASGIGGEPSIAGIVASGSTTATGTVRNLSSELSTTLMSSPSSSGFFNQSHLASGLSVGDRGLGTAPSSAVGAGTSIGGSIAGTVAAQQMAAAAAAVPGLAFDSIDSFVGANFFAPNGKGWPALGAPVIDVVGERVGQFFTHEDLLAYKKQLRGGDDKNMTSGGPQANNNTSSGDGTPSSKKATTPNKNGDVAARADAVGKAVPKIAAPSVAAAGVSVAAWDDFDALLDD